MLWWDLRQLKSNDESKRIKAIKNLGGSKDARAVEHLIPWLQYESDQVRAMAAHSLGEIGDKRAREPLRKLLKEYENNVPVESPQSRAAEVRANVNEALAKITALARARRDDEQKQLIRGAVAKRLSLPEALVFVERRINQAGTNLTPTQNISVMELLRKRHEGKVTITAGDEIPVVTVSTLILSMVFYGDRSLIVTDSSELTNGFFDRFVSGASGFSAVDAARNCGKSLVDGDFIFKKRDFQTLEDRVFDLDKIVVMTHKTYGVLCERQDEICDALKSAGDAIKVSQGELRSTSGYYLR